jgi:hypothetical protein
LAIIGGLSYGKSNVEKDVVGNRFFTHDNQGPEQPNARSI